MTAPSLDGAPNITLHEDTYSLKQGSRVNGRSRSKNGREKVWNGNPGWFLFRVNGPPPPISFRRPYNRKWDGPYLKILCLLAFFATCSTTTLLLFILINGAVQPQRNVELVGYNCAGEIPTFCKIQTGRNGSYHSASHRSKFCSKMSCFRSRILFSRTSALQSGIHRDEKEGTSIDDEFTKQKLSTYM